MQAITLPKNELDEILKSVISPCGREFGASRICRLLASKHSVRTVEVNTRCSVGNISDQVRKCINPRIRHLRLYVACVKPQKPFKNQFNQHTGEMLWSFYRHEAANDPDYNQTDSSSEIDDLKEQFPDLQTDDWGQRLTGMEGES